MQNRDYALDKLSRVFCKALFSTFPEWQQFARVVRGEETAARHIEVDVPQEGTDRQLHLSTADGEITIAFERWHTYVGPFLGLDPAGSVAQAMTIIESFINEETVVTVSCRGDVWIQSGLGYPVALGPLPSQSTTQFFSWRRTHDKTIDTA